LVGVLFNKGRIVNKMFLDIKYYFEEIGKKFDRDVEDDVDMSDDSTEEIPDLPSDDNAVPSEPESDEELGEIHAMDKLESFINSSMSTEEEIDLSKYADLGSLDETKEIDLDEIKREISNSIGKTLSKYLN
jgi:dsDNA-specific endonuclease/ATPase MutS2